jgi:hypothetical protein
LETERVLAGLPFTVHVSGTVKERITDDIDPIVVHVRSLRTGNMVFRTTSRGLGVELTEPGPFTAELELQANLPAGGYAVHFNTRDLATQKDIGAWASVRFQVEDPGTSTGDVQLNPNLRILSRV